MKKAARLAATIVMCSYVVSGCATIETEIEETGTGGFSLATESVGATPDGTTVHCFTFTNPGGMEAKVLTYGAILQSLKVPGRDGKLDDVVLGFDTLEGYLAGHPYFGATVGRYANRIAKGRFVLEGKEYSLAINNPPNTLHGGEIGFDKQLWYAEPIRETNAAGVKLTLVSPAGQEGYPGRMMATVTYRLTGDNELDIRYTATSDAPTVVNLTHHSYFNLRGAGDGDILSHELQINAGRFLPTDATAIPTGELRPVNGTPFDFVTPKAIGRDIGAEDEQIRLGGGYDHTFVLDAGVTGTPKLAATVREQTSGRVMEVYTTEPGIQLYTGNFLDGTLTGKGGAKYLHRYGFCLETQHFPDSPNQPAFPSTILQPGETYTSTTVYRFGVL